MRSLWKQRLEPARQASARALALQVLDRWELGEGFADGLLHRALEASRFVERDRHFAQELAYGVLRAKRRLDFIIDLLAEAPLDFSTRNVLRLGLFQLNETRVPEHAAVHETVALAGRAKPLVNAILRRFLRERKELLECLAAQQIAIQASHPDFLVQRWEKQFGSAVTRTLLEWNNSPPPLTLRINHLAPDAERILRSSPHVRPCSNPERFTDMVEADQLDPSWLDNGLCYVQDPSTTEVCHLLDPRPGERVLDACAAPGGKTALLAQKMQNTGDLIAADSSPQRLKQLGGNLGRLHVTNVRFTLVDWLRLDAAAKPALDLLREKPFDRILADVPCSNTGVLRRRVDARWRLDPTDFQRMPDIQLAIVDALVPLLAPGGRLAYSTCSLECEENEDLVARIIRRHPALALIEMRSLTPWNDHVDGAFCALLQNNRGH